MYRSRPFLQEQKIVCKYFHTKLLPKIALSSIFLVQMGFYATPAKASLKEKRLIAISHIGQLGKDISRKHLRTDGVLETAGAVPLAVGAGVTKIGNAIAGDVGKALGAQNEPIPLPEGNLAYMQKDTASLIDNTLGAAGNLLTLHPLRATGNIVKGVFDAADILVVDPFLDGGTALFGHAYSKKARQEVADLRLAA